MTKDELIAVLRLQHIPLIGDVNAKKLILHCGSASEVFLQDQTRLLKIAGIGSRTLKDLLAPKHLAAAKAEYEYIQTNQLAYTYFLDEDYPANLKHCSDAPILLFKSGNFNLRNRKIISVVGTRNITAYGTAFCERFVEEIAPLNPIIVSGFAYGVDLSLIHI